MSGSAPVLETERLLLRVPAKSDLEGWHSMMVDEDASCFIGGPLDRRGSWANMALMTGAWSLDSFGNFSVVEKASGRWIGRAGPWSPPSWPGNEIGWAFAKEFWGQGFAYEASRATMDWCLSALGWREVVHIIHPDNLRSIALAQRLASRFLQRLDGSELKSPVPLLVFGQTL